MPESTYESIGFKVDIRDGQSRQKLDKHQVSINHSEMTCYITSRYNQRYIVTVEKTSFQGYKSLSVELHIDGVLVKSTFLGDIGHKYRHYDTVELELVD